MTGIILPRGPNYCKGKVRIMSNENHSLMDSVRNGKEPL